MSISETGYGVDVSVRRIDDLDKRLLAAVRADENVTVLDLGCGVGGSAARLARAGAVVTGVDQHDFSTAFASQVPQGRFIQSDIATFVPAQCYDFILCQRTLHYLAYPDAVRVLQQLRPYCKKQLFLSLSGLDTDIAGYYPGSHDAIDQRFTTLASDGQEKFGITAPLCLYTKYEAFKLCAAAGWETKEVWQSAFGNIMLIAEPRAD